MRPPHRATSLLFSAFFAFACLSLRSPPAPAVAADAPLAADAPALGPGLMVGCARRDVTPTEGVPMWGYGARKAALSQGTFDPLYADAIVLAAGGKKLAIVGLDLGRSPGEKSLQNIRQRIKEGAGIEYSFIAGSHTHHGPVLELTDEEGKGKGEFDAALRYYAKLEDAIVEAILEADKGLAPATLAVGSVQLEGFNRNRHSKIEPKPVDRELAVMRFDVEGKTRAVLVNFAAHPTIVSAAGLQFSADFVAEMKKTVEQETGGLTVFMQGAAGDLSVDTGRHADPNDPDNRHGAFGRALGKEAAKLAASLKPMELPPAPSLEMWEERLKFDSRINFQAPATALLYGAAFFPELVANYVDEYADGVRPRLTVALLNGEVALVGVSGEFFANHSVRLKQRARVKQLFFFGYCNGYHQYFPTIEAVAEGGYGADRMVSPAEVGAGERIMDEALIWIYQMRGEIW